MNKLSNVEIDISEYSISPSSIHEWSASACLLSQLCPNFSRNALPLVLFVRASVVRPGENLNSGFLRVNVHKFPYFSIPLLMYSSSSGVNTNGLRILTESLLFWSALQLALGISSTWIDVSLSVAPIKWLDDQCFRLISSEVISQHVHPQHRAVFSNKTVL